MVMASESLVASSENLQTAPKNEIRPETSELRDKIAALDTELSENFKTQFSTAPIQRFMS